MCFKKRFQKGFQITLGIFLLFGIQACGLKVGEHVSKDVSLHMQKNEKCLEKVGQNIQKLWKGTLSASKLARTSRCMKRSLRVFIKYARGKKQGVYENGELKAFFETYFLNKQKLSLDFYQELFFFKSWFLGGNEREVSKKEMRRLIHFFQLVEQQAKKIVLLFPLVPKHLEKLSERHIFYKKELLKRILIQAWKVFKNHRNKKSLLKPYAITGKQRAFESMLKKAETAITTNHRVSLSAITEKLIPLVALKTFFFPREAKNEWNRISFLSLGRLLGIGAEGYGMGLHFLSIRKKFELLSKKIPFWKMFSGKHLNEFLSFLDEGYFLKKNKRFQKNRVMQLFPFLEKILHGYEIQYGSKRALSFQKVSWFLDIAKKQGWFPYVLIHRGGLKNKKRQAIDKTHRYYVPVQITLNEFKTLFVHLVGEAFIRNTIPVVLEGVKENEKDTIVQNWKKSAQWRRYGVSLLFVRNLKKMILFWTYGLKFLRYWAKEQSGANQHWFDVEVPMEEAFKNSFQESAQKFLNRISFSEESARSRIVHQVVTDLKNMVLDKKTRPLFKLGHSMMYFDQKENLKYSYYSLFHMQWLRTLIRLVGGAYDGYRIPKDLTGWTKIFMPNLKGKTLPEKFQFCQTDPAPQDLTFKSVLDHLKNGMEKYPFHCGYYFHFRPLGIQLRLFDDVTYITMLNRFIEADIFTAHANGDSKVNLNEGMDLLGIMYSGKVFSGNLNKLVSMKLDRACENKKSKKTWIVSKKVCNQFQKGLLDKYGGRWIPSFWLRKEFLGSLKRVTDKKASSEEEEEEEEKLWDGMPLFVADIHAEGKVASKEEKFAQEANENTSLYKNNIYSGLERISSIVKDIKGGELKITPQVGVEELDNFGIFIHYMESVFTRFKGSGKISNSNSNGVLSGPDVMEAYRVFWKTFTGAIEKFLINFLKLYPNDKGYQLNEIKCVLTKYLVVSESYRNAKCKGLFKIKTKGGLVKDDKKRKQAVNNFVSTHQVLLGSFMQLNLDELLKSFFVSEQLDPRVLFTFFLGKGFNPFPKKLKGFLSLQNWWKGISKTTKKKKKKKKKNTEKEKFYNTFNKEKFYIAYRGSHDHRKDYGSPARRNRIVRLILEVRKFLKPFKKESKNKKKKKKTP